VSLTYDDGITSHVDIVGPDLAARRLAATFFISDQANLVRPSGATRQKWIELHKGGHEFASHTINHPCSQTMDWVPPQFALEVYTLERMARELDDSIALTAGLAGGTAPTTFAYPCASDWVGSPPQSYAGLVKARFRAARGGKPGVANPSTVDLHDVPTFGPEGTSAAELVEWVDRAVAQGGWLVFTFHGVGGDYITVTREAHAALLMALDARRTEVWTERFAAVADYVAGHR
jgi:peptidoglycan/xylan/chitin deacetylase (PgdA/CDA1 family)